MQTAKDSSGSTMRAPDEAAMASRCAHPAFGHGRNCVRESMLATDLDIRGGEGCTVSDAAEAGGQEQTVAATPANGDREEPIRNQGLFENDKGLSAYI